MSKKPTRKKQTPPEEKNQIEELVIRNKITALKKQLEDFLAQANRQAAHLTGAIEALEALLPENQAKEEAEAEPKEKAPAEESPADA